MTNIDWPVAFERTDAVDREPNRSFEATIADTTRDIATEMDRMDVDEWRASTGSGGPHTKPSGMPKHSANPDDPGFVLYWTKDGEQYAVACDASPKLRDNVRYCYKWINETRMRSNRPVETGDSEFATARLPSGDEEATTADPPAHIVLDVDRDATPAAVESAFREKAREVHPDAGGSEEAFKRAQRAKERLLPDEPECVTDGGVDMEDKQ
ncbi:J domain-containing protein [Halohasta salina]|uniref:J domain-containing protein n=1 Tax=Halohasta salina TaxID=2961621 RepID=UPI0020A40495|nr:J domain-containing protein [Halohasta salina]